MSLDSLLSELKTLVENGDVAQGKAVLSKLKIAILEGADGSPETLQKSCSALELGVLLAVADNDLDAFGRNMAQLQPYYMSGVASTRKAHIMGLNLMHLLVENRLSEFHSELELLSEKEAADPLISFPIGLERKLMVGIYDEVLAGKIPNPSYQLFMEHLLQTVRDSIADCIEVSYKTLKLKDAAEMMKFSNVAELQDYIQNFRDDWIVEAGDLLTFQPPSTIPAATDIPSMEYIKQSLTYATEMERIV
ncbi:regulatory proteasome non-atpase subunit 12 [Phaeodactylum tricornutum CCAP 1055/1]|jgi:26S proteasome regulatory subunit N12|uniref:Regulatory proteasome non-atpase subunit 12 n=1 Tax=Phaeodactylum tricornutum (strain CCAP 1055/1) TaxID=556484 RepID=B7FZY2_PHATC|nr:regulatory proteasome non-atpase subunit 12 [Phaeodactylum tricornutum CCAP 1055/1]EEC47791.1 regulatory proteasome non-atpase subunit 12 [Phaeodactylum tricornutum CCAP 1055/1]|eukprot:XP_002180383.1 regulatory proteasome non-atpase subunit 12 [Phaeodactylum tricornutum CCAP 1055/1]